MAPEFYLAIGSKPRRRDVVVSQLVGQHRFLVPLGTDGAAYLAGTPGAAVAGDSGAYPPNNPERISLPAYAGEILEWAGRPGFRFALSYDHIGNPDATERDDARLGHLVERLGDPLPVVPVAHVGQDVRDVLDDPLSTLDRQERRAALAYGLSYTAGPLDRPAIALGGIAAARYAGHALSWLDRFLAQLARLSLHDPSIATVHLLGVGRAELAIRSPLIESFDSSGPVRTAGFGWGNIAPNYTEAYGLRKPKLQASREARLAYLLCQLRDRVGLPWTPADPEALQDDEPQRLHPSALVPQQQKLAL